jgi:hypothetical protein
MNVSDFFKALMEEHHFVLFSKETSAYRGPEGVEFGFLKLHPDFFPRKQVSALSLW